MEAFGFGPSPQRSQAGGPGLGQPDSGQANPVTPVQAAVEPQAVQAKPVDAGATPIGHVPPSPDLDKEFKAQVDRVEAARQKIAKSQAAMEGFQVACDRAAQLAEAAKHKCESAVEQHTHLEEAWGWEQQKLDEIRHRFAHNGG